MIAGVVAGGRPVSVTPPSVTDPHWADVMLLINWESGYSDLSSNAYPTTPGAYALLDTTTKKFGAASVGCSDYSRWDVLTAASTPAALLTGDYTIEWWLYISYRGDGSFPYRSNFNHAIGIDAAGTLSVEVVSSDYPYSNIGFNHQTVIPLNTWTHIAVVKSANVIRSYVNGVRSTASTTETDVRNHIAGTIIALPGSMRVDAYRITKGVARYSGDFTPPSEAFPTS